MLDHVDAHLAHQRKIAEVLRGLEPRKAPASLDGFTVGLCTRDEALPIILKYEWLGNMGKAKHFVALRSPERAVYGVACFGHGPGGGIRNVIGEPALCLERGACVHYAPRNAASFLIAHACRLMAVTHGVQIFYAYGDPCAGEYGAVYQACNWIYLGQGLQNGKDRPMRRYVLPPGADPSSPANWKTTRALRQGKRNLTFEAAKALGWQIEWRAGKHVYATNIGRDRKKWRKAMPSKPYPAPRPELKLKV